MGARRRHQPDRRTRIRIGPPIGAPCVQDVGTNLIDGHRYSIEPWGGCVSARRRHQPDRRTRTACRSCSLGVRGARRRHQPDRRTPDTDGSLYLREGVQDVGTNLIDGHLLGLPKRRTYFSARRRHQPDRRTHDPNNPVVPSLTFKNSPPNCTTVTVAVAISRWRCRVCKTSAPT